MFVEVQDRSGRPFLVNTDHVRTVAWDPIGDTSTVNAVLTWSTGDRLPVQLEAADKATLWESLRALTGVSLQHDSIK